MPNPIDHLTPDAVYALLTSRRTAHQFANQQPTAEALQRIITAGIECARWAPNHGLSEPWDFYHLGQDTATQVARLNAELVRQSKGDAAAEKKLQRWLDMPEWLLVTQRLPRASLRDSYPDKYTLLKQEDYAATACAIQNFMLYCHSQNLACKWSTGGITRAPELYQLLTLDPQAQSIVGLLWIGVAAEADRPVPKRKRCVEDIYHKRP